MLPTQRGCSACSASPFHGRRDRTQPASVRLHRRARGAGFAVTPPLWRGDVVMAADLVEEIARVVGYERVRGRGAAGRAARYRQRRVRSRNRTRRNDGRARLYRSALALAAAGIGRRDAGATRGVATGEPVGDHQPSERRSTLDALFTCAGTARLCRPRSRRAALPQSSNSGTSSRAQPAAARRHVHLTALHAGGRERVQPAQVRRSDAACGGSPDATRASNAARCAASIPANGSDSRSTSTSSDTSASSIHVSRAPMSSPTRRRSRPSFVEALPRARSCRATSRPRASRPSNATSRSWSPSDVPAGDALDAVRKRTAGARGDGVRRVPRPADRCREEVARAAHPAAKRDGNVDR